MRSYDRERAGACVPTSVPVCVSGGACMCQVHACMHVCVRARERGLHCLHALVCGCEPCSLTVTFARPAIVAWYASSEYANPCDVTTS
jgi:hypothetical protein